MTLPMYPDKPLLITVKHVYAGRRKWRERWALIRWIMQDRIYAESNAPFGIVGHENFSVNGRKNSDEIELKFFDPMRLGRSQAGADMENEMLEALKRIARKYNYPDAYYRKCRRSFFA